MDEIDDLIAKLKGAKNTTLSEDEDYAVRTIIGEAKGEGEKGWEAVADVIRTRSKQSGKRIKDVVLAPSQFEPWQTRRKELEGYDPNSSTYQRVAQTVLPVLRGERKGPVGDMTHFYSPTVQAAMGRKPPSWAKGPGFDFGNHRFYNLGYGGKGKHGIPDDTDNIIQQLRNAEAPITADDDVDGLIAQLRGAVDDKPIVTPTVQGEKPLIAPGQPLAPDPNEIQTAPAQTVAPPIDRLTRDIDVLDAIGAAAKEGAEFEKFVPQPNTVVQPAVQRANTPARRVARPKTSQPQANIDRDVRVEPGQNPRQVLENAAVEMVLEQGLDVTAEDVQDAWRQNPKIQGSDDTKLSEVQKSGGVIPFTIDRSFLNDVAQAKQNRIARGEAEARYKAELEKYKGELSPDEPQSAASIKALRDAGFLSNEQADAKLTEEQKEYERLKKEQAGSRLQLWSGQVSEEELQQDDRARTNKFVESILQEHASLADYRKEQDRLEKEYKYRPLAKPLEFARNFGGAVPKAVASLLKTADIALNMNPLKIGADAVRGKDWTIDETTLSSVGDSINKYIESTKNKDIKDPWLTVIPDTLGQLGVQIAAGVLTGGATLPTLIGAASGAASQYDEAKKFNATDKQKLTAALVGGLAAAPDAILFGKWFKGAGAAEKQGFLRKLGDSLLARLGVKYGDDVAQEVVDAALPKIVTNILKGSGFEGSQEVIENKVNDLLALKTYDPSEARRKKLISITDEDVLSFIGGVIGGGVAGGVLSKVDNNNASQIELKVDELLEKGEITDVQAEKIKAQVAQAVEDADKGAGKDVAPNETTIPSQPAQMETAEVLPDKKAKEKVKEIPPADVESRVSDDVSGDTKVELKPGKNRPADLPESIEWTERDDYIQSVIDSTPKKDLRGTKLNEVVNKAGAEWDAQNQPQPAAKDADAQDTKEPSPKKATSPIRSRARELGLIRPKEEVKEIPQPKLESSASSDVSGEAKGESKEPWQMSRDEYADYSHLQQLHPRTKRPTRADRIASGGLHERAVKEALAEGKPVPPEVLADYPDLQTTESKASGEAKVESGVTELEIKPRFQFLHKRVIDPRTKKPMAYEVTRVAKGTVYYRPQGGGKSEYVSLKDFPEKVFGGRPAWYRTEKHVEPFTDDIHATVPEKELAQRDPVTGRLSWNPKAGDWQILEAGKAAEQKTFGDDPDLQNSRARNHAIALSAKTELERRQKIRKERSLVADGETAKPLDSPSANETVDDQKENTTTVAKDATTQETGRAISPAPTKPSRSPALEARKQRAADRKAERAAGKVLGVDDAVKYAEGKIHKEPFDQIRTDLVRAFRLKPAQVNKTLEAVYPMDERIEDAKAMILLGKTFRGQFKYKDAQTIADKTLLTAAKVKRLTEEVRPMGQGRSFGNDFNKEGQKIVADYEERQALREGRVPGDPLFDDEISPTEKEELENAYTILKRRQNPDVLRSTPTVEKDATTQDDSRRISGKEQTVDNGRESASVRGGGRNDATSPNLRSGEGASNSPSHRGGVSVETSAGNKDTARGGSGDAKADRGGGAESGTTPRDNFQDYGEKIGGAKKDLIRDVAAITTDDLTTQPLSKAFPRPDFNVLVKDGSITRDAAKALSFFYDNIPAKPRKAYKVAAWVKKVENVVEMYRNALGGLTNDAQAFLAEARKRGFSHLADGFEVYSEWLDVNNFPEQKPPAMGAYSLKKFTRFDPKNPKPPEYSVIKNNRYIQGTFPTAKEAAEALKTILAQPSKGTEFSIYQDRASKDFFIGKKGAGGVVRLVTGLADVKAARAFIAENQAQLDQMWDARKYRQGVERKDTGEEVREAKDWRDGKDIASTEEFAKTFGFRGVEFGNWVKQGASKSERQAAINDSYDALRDLADLLEIDPKALSLDGSLALALGARGSGTASAHYEPTKVVINLTKTRGKGSLGHEWWHALDNYFGRMRGEKGGFVTDYPHVKTIKDSGMFVPDPSVRKELLDAYKGVTDAIKASGMVERSRNMDATRSTPYWSTMVEMTARAFENYIITRLAEQGQRSDFLANFRDMADWGKAGFDVDAFPYPLASEQDAINAAFDDLFAVMESVETESGNVALRKQPENRADLDKLKTKYLDELAPDVQTEYKGENVVEINAEASELIRSGLAMMQGTKREAQATVGSLFTEPQNASNLIEAFDDMIATAKEEGIDSKQIEQLVKDIKKASKDDGTVIFDGGGLEHEQIHYSSWKGADGKRLVDRYANIDEIAKDDDFKTFWDELNKLQGDSSIGVVAEEALAYLGSGDYARFGLTEAQAVGILQKLVNGYAEANGVNSLKNFEAEKIYEAIETYREGQSSKTSNDSGRKVSEEREAGSEPAKEKPDKAGEKQRKAAFSRILGQDYYYDPQSHEETERRAQQLLSDKGTEQAIFEALNGKPSAETMRVVYFELERLNGLADHYLESGNNEAFNAVAQEIANLSSQIVARQVRTGQEVEIAKTLAPMSPEVAILAATRMKKFAEGNPDATLSDVQAKQIVEIAKELKAANQNLAEANLKLKKAERKIKRLESDREPTRRTSHARLLKEYQQKKPDLLAKLREAFPDSPVFNGKESALRMVADTGVLRSTPPSNLDAAQEQLLTEYAAGMILEGRTYDDVIQTLTDIAGTGVKSVHAAAVEQLKPTRGMSDETKARLQTRQEHYRKAEEFTNPNAKAERLLKSIEKRLKSQIAELEREIETGVDEKGEKLKVTSPEVEALKRERNALQARHDEIFPKEEKAELTPAQRVKRAEAALERSIADLEKQLKDGRKDQKAPLPESERLKELRAIRTELATKLKDATLSGIAQDAQDQGKSEEIVFAIDRLTGEKPKNINDVIRDIREKFGLDVHKATDLARQARQTVREIKAARSQARDEAKAITPELRKELNEAKIRKARATYRLNKFLNQLANRPWLMERFNNDFRAKLVSNWATQLFNAVQGVSSTSIESVLDLMEATIKAVGNPNPETTLDINVKDTWLPLAYVFSNNKQLAEQALAEFPEEYYKVHSGLLGDIELETPKLAPDAPALTKPGHWWFDKNDQLNKWLSKVSGAKMQEMHFRNAIVASSFDQVIRKKSGGTETLKTAIENGTLTKYITEQDAKIAADKALRVTFAALIDDPIGRQLKRGYDQMDKILPVMLNPVTFARFTYTTTKVMVANPLLMGALDSKTLGGEGYNARSMAKGVLGWSGVAMAYGILSAFGDDDDRWETITVNGTTYDVRRFFPMSSYFYVAHLIKSQVEGRPLPKPKEVLEGFASLETDYFQYGAAMELAKTTFGATQGQKDSSDVGAASARMLGAYLSGLLRFAKPMRDTFAQFDKEEAKMRDFSDSAKDQFIKEISKSLPLVARGIAPQKDAVTGKDIEQQAPMARMIGINVVHPSFLSAKQTPATEWAERLFVYTPSGEWTEEQRKAFYIRKRLKNAVYRGEVKAKDLDARIAEFVRDKKLTPRSADILKKDLQLSELQFRLKYGYKPGSGNSLMNKKLDKVMRYATESEKADIQKVIGKRISKAAR